MSLRVLKVTPGLVVNGRFKPVHTITDRAKRYRAQNIPLDKRCFACGSPRARDRHHIDGHESHGDVKNLARACRSCNVRIGNVMRKAGLGKKTQQFNPTATGASSLGQYLSAVQIVRGAIPGNVKSAVALLHATSPGTRSRFAKQIWETRRERYGPTGRQDSLPF